MRFWLGCAAATVALVTGISSARGQTTVNPDISIIPRFLINSDDAAEGNGSHRWRRPDFSFQELELAVQAYLNPYAQGNVILTVPGPDIEKAKLGIEEVYASIVRGLPLDLNLRFGKYRTEFGKFNLMHPHMWPFITEPIMESRFLGEGGLNDLGISASLLLPTGDIYSKLTADLLRGGSIGESAGIADTTDAAPYYAVSGRLSAFFTLSDLSDLEMGLSGLTAIHDPYARDRFWYGNVDVKYKYRPSTYTSLVVQGEYLVNRRNAERGPGLELFTNAVGAPERRKIVSSGAYLYADYQFFKIYSIGVRYDWSQSPYSSSDLARAVSAFLGYYPVEETLGVRLEYQHAVESGATVNAVALQLLFSLGPHKAHAF